MGEIPTSQKIANVCPYRKLGTTLNPEQYTNCKILMDLQQTAIFKPY